MVRCLPYSFLCQSWAPSLGTGPTASDDYTQYFVFSFYTSMSEKLHAQQIQDSFHNAGNVNFHKCIILICFSRNQSFNNYMTYVASWWWCWLGRWMARCQRCCVLWLTSGRSCFPSDLWYWLSFPWPLPSLHRFLVTHPPTTAPAIVKVIFKETVRAGSHRDADQRNVAQSLEMLFFKVELLLTSLVCLHWKTMEK